MGLHIPSLVHQTLENSCWAAVLECWSRNDPQMPQGLRQQDLIDRWGEGPTGGITPEIKIPQIARAYGLRLPDGRFRSVVPYLQSHLDTSYLFCASSVPGSAFMHSVLIYRVRANNVDAMDPDRGRYHTWHIADFENLGAHIVMHRP